MKDGDEVLKNYDQPERISLICTTLSKKGAQLDIQVAKN